MSLNLPIYELKLNNLDDGVFCISLVEYPAIEEDFLVFDSQSPINFTKIDEDKHILYGPAMIPEMLIYRRDESGREYYVKFSKETIAEIVERFARNNYISNISLNHETPVEGCFVFNSYLIDRKSGIDPIQFKDIEDGSWIVGVKVDNLSVWNEVKNTDLLRGFSVEVLATPYKMSKEDNWLNNLFKGVLK